MKRSYLIHGLILFSLLLFGACNHGQNETGPPNILFIAVDDLRPELNCFGASQIHSPRLDELAREGLIFTEAHCNVPVCGASRASLMTGTRPTRYRYLDYLTRAEVDYPGALGIHQHFKNNGYYTVSNGKVFHHKNDLAEGWDEIWRIPGELSPRDYMLPGNAALDNTDARGPAYESADVPDSSYRDGKLALKAMKDLRRLKEMDKPFFLACGFLKPHLPFNAPSTYWNLYEPEDIKLPENSYPPENAPAEAIHNFGELRSYSFIPGEGRLNDSLARTLIHGYYACVSYVDHLIGLILDELDKLDLADNTIVILWGDHGWNLREHGLWCKHCNFRTSLRSTLMIRVPGRTRGQETDALVEFVDIYPSLCELAGLELPGHLEGRSFVPLLDDPGRPWKDLLILKWKDGLTIKTREHAYTEWSRTDSAVIARMLYDHVNDLQENVNISEDSGNRQLIESLSKLMYENRGEDFNKPVPPVKTSK